MLNFEQYNEALKISDYRKYHQDFHQGDFMKFYFMKFPDHNRNYERIYFPLNVKPQIHQIPYEITSFLNSRGYYFTSIEDYITGVCNKYEDKRKHRIGKIINTSDDDIKNKLLNLFTHDPIRQIKDNDLMVVISRHIYDIAGMSTDRRWTSCHDLYDKKYGGKYHYQMHQDIRNGAIVAYLITSGDRNIKTPLARITIGTHGHDKKRMHLYVKGYYGINYPEFRDLVERWCMDFNSRDKKKD